MRPIDHMRGLVDQPVELVSWPDEQRLRRALARAGVPRLLVVGAHAPVPDDLGLDEDWVRVTAAPDDVAERAARLARTAARLDREPPFLDDAHVLHRGSASVALPASAAALLAVLLEHRGTMVALDDLEQLVWAGAAPSRHAVHTAVSRLRGRLAGLHLVIRNVRDRGFVLDDD